MSSKKESKTSKALKKAIPQAASMNIDAIIQDVLKNNTKLKNCEGPHVFVEIEEPGPGLRHRKLSRCTKCSGTLEQVKVHWYNKGVEDGRKM